MIPAQQGPCNNTPVWWGQAPTWLGTVEAFLVSGAVFRTALAAVALEVGSLVRRYVFALSDTTSSFGTTRCIPQYLSE